MNAKIDDWLYVTAAAAGLFVVTVLTRGSFAFLPARFRLPKRVDDALRFAPACALTAIIAPSVLAKNDGSFNLDLDNYRLWAVLVAAVVFAKTRNMLLMMGIGMAVFTALRKFG